MGIFSFVAPLLGGLLESDGSKDAARAQTRANEAAIAEQRRQFDLIMGMQAPYQQVGTQALNALARLYGYTPGVTPTPASTATAEQTGPLASRLRPFLANRNGVQLPENAPTAPGFVPPDQSGLPTGLDVFTASPDYQFRRGEGMRGIENSFAARGGAASGNALRALAEFNSGLASTEFGNFFNRQASLAGIGQAATNNASNAAFNTGSNIGGLLADSGNARASGIAGRTNAWTNTLQNLLSAYERRGAG